MYSVSVPIWSICTLERIVLVLLVIMLHNLLECHSCKVTFGEG